jgi:thioredoxin-like negative regulator of GroEL
MRCIETELDLENALKNPALMVLFGGEHCGVCQAIKPKLEQMVKERYPRFELVYVDCQNTPSVCAQQSVFSLPVVKVFFEGQLFIEKARSFSLSALLQEVERPYGMLFA